jgi:hypothetical protein
MMTVKKKSCPRIIRPIILLLLGLLLVAPTSRAEVRTMEFRFELSDDVGSEFSMKLPVYSPGLLKVEAEWKPVNLAAESAAPQTALTLILLRPNGTEAARTSGPSPLRFEMRVSEQDLGRTGDRASWTVKIINGATEKRREVKGTLRTLIPITAGTLVENDFVLFGSGNAREFPFVVSGAGRLMVEATWEALGQADAALPPAALSIVLLHPGEDKVYARRQGRSPVKIEQQITAGLLDRGTRWIVRLQNDREVKVKGRVRITFTPEL